MIKDLDHANIVSVYEIIDDDRSPYLFVVRLCGKGRRRQRVRASHAEIDPRWWGRGVVLTRAGRTQGEVVWHSSWV